MVVIANNYGIGLGPCLECGMVIKGQNPNKALDGIIDPPQITDNILLFAGVGLGEEATKISAECTVYGASKWTDEINSDLEKRIRLSYEIGMSIPAYKKFQFPEERDLYCLDNPFWVPIYKTLAIKTDRGIPLCTEAFYENGVFKNYMVKVYGNRLLKGNKGCQAESAMTVTFTQPNPVNKPLFLELAKQIQKNAPEYRGPVTIETISTDKHWYHDLKFGYDFDHEYGKMALYGKEVVFGKGNYCKGFVVTVRLYDIRKEGLYLDRVVDIDRKYLVPIECKMEDGRLRSCGEVPLVAIGMGTTIKQAFENCYEWITKIGVRDLCYRSDGEKYAVDWWRRAKGVKII